jgi:transcriptional regulator with PAS, ATPase and Fis domain
MAREDADATRSEMTADPVEGLGAGDRGPLVASVCVLFHSDLRRIGQRFDLGPVRERSSAREVVFGRTEPILIGGGAPPGPLLDPCISRRQLTLRWNGGTQAFEVEAEAGSRRKVALLQRDGTFSTLTRQELPPESVVAIDDRVLLGLSLVRAQGAVHPDLIGESPAMDRLFETLEALAVSEETVLVVGETGTGKEIVARTLHALSGRRDKPFVALNCAALPDQLLESELFGHARGAFTGAVTPRPGLFRAAQGGTLFLDEVGELSTAAQSKLLRVLQERSLRAVGQELEQRIDVRVVAATNQSLRDLVDKGRFRLDLLTRLDGLSISVPPLRERPLDIPRLFVHFLSRAIRARGVESVPWLRDATLFPPPVPLALFCELLRQRWPGNVRQLERFAIACATLSLARGAFVSPELDGPESATASPAASDVVRTRPTREELMKTLQAHDYVQHRVSRELGIPQATLSRWLDELEITRPGELDREVIEKALAECDGDLKRAAVALRVSARGLRLRIAALGLEEKIERRR